MHLTPPSAPPTVPSLDDLPDDIAPEKAFAIASARELADRHCEDVLVLDVRGISPLTQFVVIASGTSDRQMRSAGVHLKDIARAFDYERLGSDRDDGTTWIVLDFVDVMVHLFEPATRGHYDLEMMWGDAPRITWRR
jgi:ribosome-associated protein